MKESEFWLLTTAIDLPVEVSIIMNPEELSMDLGAGHNFSVKEMAHSLYNLLQSKDITLDENSIPPTIEKIPSAPQEWEIYMRHENGLQNAGKYGLYYRLTEQGGALWEEFAKPDWDSYVIEAGGTDPQGREELFLAASNREIIEKIVSFSVTPIPGTQVWNEVSPWDIFYWKTLEKGVEMRCSYESEQCQWGEAEYEIYSKYVGNNWYTNPWQAEPNSDQT